MKKVWIAGILTILMLIVPINSVVGANEVEDCNCKLVISDSQVVRIERLLDRLESRIDFILLKYGHISGIEENHQEISNKIIKLREMNEELKLASPLQVNEIICIILYSMSFGALWVMLSISAMVESYHGTILYYVLLSITFPIFMMVALFGASILSISVLFGCDEFFP